MKTSFLNKPVNIRGMVSPLHKQRGAITIFTAVFVMILMTLMLVYANRIGVIEQRVSSNDMRQKLAFHAAEAGLQQSAEYLRANVKLVNSSSPRAGPDGLGTNPPGFKAGWFYDDVTTRRWRPCPSTAADDHPCGGEVPAVAGSFYYDTDGNDSTRESLPINTGALAANTTARVSATACRLSIATDGTMSCDTSLPSPVEDDLKVLVTLMGYGYSDCADITDPDSCKSRSTVSVQFTSLSSTKGGRGVPLVTKNTLPITGTAEIVPNPNAGGVGVPVSVWANGRTSQCPPLDDSGAQSQALGHKDTSWATCYYREWFGVNQMPDPLACPPGGACKCSASELISGPVGGNTTIVGTDIHVDDVFPCDLFEYYFGVPSNLYQLVKANAEVYSDCSGLNQDSSGLIWISGPGCRINSNTIIGTEENPVLLVIASADTKINGGAVIYGTVFVTEVEVAGATFEALGGVTIFGQALIDAIFSKLQGSFQIVYNESVVVRSREAKDLGILNHGWRDWGLPDIAW